jgi:predicted CoA-binding protein
MKKKTLVLGASDKQQRYSFLAIKSLLAKGHQVVGIGKQKSSVDDVQIETEKLPHSDIDTVSVYLNPNHQKEYYNYILGLNPKRIIFNPGAENEELEELARQNKIEPINACTLVMLSTGQY